MWVYIDESGNTGANVFDSHAPYFITTALCTKTNFDLVWKNEVVKINKKLGVSALHANELGVARIEEIAADILRIIKKSNSIFYVANLEKRYICYAKFFDVYFDQGENKAVPYHVYWIKEFKLLFLFKLIECDFFTDEIIRDVWTCVTATNEEKSKKYFLEGVKKALERIEYISDARVREVVAEALNWAVANPTNFSTYLPDKTNRYSHAPNFIGFTQLLNGIEAVSRKWGRKVNTITHDEQINFRKLFCHFHDLLSKSKQQKDISLDLTLGDDCYLFSGVAVGSHFRMLSDKESAGLQIVDIVMWLLKREMEGKKLGKNCYRLLNFVKKRGYYSDFTINGTSRQLNNKLEKIMAMRMTEADIAKGRNFLRIVEQNRQSACEHKERDNPLGGNLL